MSDWKVVKVRRDLLEDVRAHLWESSGSGPLGDAPLVNAALVSLQRECRGELLRPEDVATVLREKLLEAEAVGFRKGYREGVQELARQLLGRDATAIVTEDGELRFAVPDGAGGG